MHPVAAAQRWPHLVKVEDEVQLADIAKVAVQDLNKVVNDLQREQLIVCGVHAHHKVQAGIPLVHYLQQASHSCVTPLKAWPAADRQQQHEPAQNLDGSQLPYL